MPSQRKLMYTILYVAIKRTQKAVRFHLPQIYLIFIASQATCHFKGITLTLGESKNPFPLGTFFTFWVPIYISGYLLLISSFQHPLAEQLYRSLIAIITWPTMSTKPCFTPNHTLSSSISTSVHIIGWLGELERSPPSSHPPTVGLILLFLYFT